MTFDGFNAVMRRLVIKTTEPDCMATPKTDRYTMTRNGRELYNVEITTVWEHIEDEHHYRGHGLEPDEDEPAIDMLNVTIKGTLGTQPYSYAFDLEYNGYTREVRDEDGKYKEFDTVPVKCFIDEEEYWTDEDGKIWK